MKVFEYALFPESGYTGEYEREDRHFRFKHGTVADLLHDSMRLYYSDFDKRIPTLEEMNEILESVDFGRAAECKPFYIGMEEYKEVVECLLNMKLERPYVYIKESEWELFDMIETHVISEKLIPAKIYLYEKSDVIMMKLRYNEIVLVETAENCFDALVSIRKRLQSCNENIACMGSCKVVYPSGMCSNMGYGDKAYKLTLGKAACHEDLVSIFEVCDPSECVTVEEQEKYFNEWVNSL